MYSLNLEKLKRAIEKSGYKQKWIARQIGVSERVFSHMLSGRTKWEVVAYYKLCVLLNFQCSEFILKIENEREVS